MIHLPYLTFGLSPLHWANCRFVHLFIFSGHVRYVFHMDLLMPILYYSFPPVYDTWYDYEFHPCLEGKKNNLILYMMRAPLQVGYD